MSHPVGRCGTDLPDIHGGLLTYQDGVKALCGIVIWDQVRKGQNCAVVQSTKVAINDLRHPVARRGAGSQDIQRWSDIPGCIKL
jgi:hypothetical protein